MAIPPGCQFTGARVSAEGRSRGGLRESRRRRTYHDFRDGAAAPAGNPRNQEAHMKSKPVAQHKWLQKLVGEWAYESEMLGQGDTPPLKCSGTESVRSVGGLWIVGEGRGEMPGGGEATMLMTLGYDPARKRFVGTWIGSMMATLWVYDGVLKGNTLTLSTVGPDFSGKKKIARYRDTIKLLGRDRRVLMSSTPGKGGRWMTFMTAHYRRVK
jgi:hypothetical protein